MAQLGGALMILGGIADLGVRELLPHHLTALSNATGSVPDEAGRLVLALLHALGGALVAAGIAVLVLLRAGRRSGDRLLIVAAAVVAILAEGPNAWGILMSGSPLYVAPLAFMLLVVIGCIAMARVVRYAAAGGPNQVVSASTSPDWETSPTQQT